MPIATLTHIEKTFGQRTLFDKLNLNVYRGERIGLIGDNGAGKTSLFKALVGELPLDAGAASTNKSIKVGYLRQDPQFDAANTVIDEAELAFAELHDLAHRLRDLEHEMAHLQGDELEKVLGKYTAVQAQFDLAGGHAWRHKLEATLHGVGLEESIWEQPVGTLSGGQKSRLALAKLLIAAPDLLLLDEPTNHLDLAAIEWLERYLNDFSGAVVLISHDRFLLDRVCNRICWLVGGRIKSYKGNYSAFVQQRELEELSQALAFVQQQADDEKQQEFIRRFQAGQRSKEARGRLTRLTRFLKSDEVVAAVGQQKQINLKLSTDQRAGDNVLAVRELSKAYDGKVLWRDIVFQVKRGERIGVIGPNGAGKTTLLEVVMGRRDADAGDVRWGANLNIGYYDQKLGLEEFDPENTVMDEVLGDRQVSGQELRNVLATMLFRGNDVEKKIAMLSGGERARVRLAQLLLDKPNVLLLDEPTNHLDIASREALENSLSGFEGTIFCVSHDRYFLDKIARRLLVLDPPGVMSFDGNYTQWNAKLAADRAAEIEKEARRAASATAATSANPKSDIRSPQSPAPAPDKKKKDNPYLRPFGRLTIQELEQQITDTEIAIAECQEHFADPEVFRDPAAAQRLQKEAAELSTKLEQLEAEYYARET
ncbi:MAG TPA: ABC-F family ATP-binding cassette domain-containing protein [Tepidisphaeraceae bacterium]|nr:ABC-F family ATP-binding cassette domain-containing protein [Tepidisphaeraceae bacterium]